MQAFLAPRELEQRGQFTESGAMDLLVGTLGRSAIGLYVVTQAVISDRRCSCSVVHEQPWRQELRVGGQIGGDLPVEERARNRVNVKYPD